MTAPTTMQIAGFQGAVIARQGGGLQETFK